MCSTAGDIEDIADCSTSVGGSYKKEFLSKCKKCSEKSVVLLQKKDPFCKVCFFEYCNHKFRSTIGKSKKIKHGDKVLISCSGGHKSAALLHMTAQTLKSASMKQISFTPAILFIDELFLDNPSSEHSKTDALLIIKHTQSANYPILYSSLEMVYKIKSSEELFVYLPENCSSDVLIGNEDLRAALNESFRGMPLSSKIDLLKHLRLLLVTEIAARTGHNCVFLGDTASSLAVELLSDIALGRGSQISSDTSFYDTRYKVPLCRPLREFLNKEVALYSHLHSVNHHVLPDFLTKAPSNSCIQRLTETFLSSLQENFPATIFTVFRTGGKLSRNNISLDKENCVICNSELDNTNPDSCSALNALKISHKLSSDSKNAVKEYISTDIMRFLCHGCSATFENVPNPEYFQSLFSETMHVKMDRSGMKEEIKDFIIDDNIDA